MFLRMKSKWKFAVCDECNKFHIVREIFTRMHKAPQFLLIDLREYSNGVYTRKIRVIASACIYYFMNN